MSLWLSNKMNIMRKNLVIWGLVVCSPFIGACNDDTPIAPPLDEGSYGEYELVWSEEFDNDGLPDSETWVYEQGYMRNNESQDYKVSDLKYSCIEDGRLILTAYTDPHVEGSHTFGHSSASITTKKKVGFQYGRIDISAKLPKGRGIWPALWMRPTENRFDGAYAEIDIMEHVWGSDPNHGMVIATIHNQDSWDKKYDDSEQLRSMSIFSPTLNTEFHLYSLVWTETQIDILFDNELVLTFEKLRDDYKHWPFDQPFFLILNVAVGGSWGGSWGIDETIFPQRMEVDYIRYYKKME